MQDKLSEDVELQQILLQALSDMGKGVVVTKGSRILYANPAFARMVGYAREELVSRTFDFHQLRAPEDGLEPKGRLASARHDAPPQRFEMVLIRKDGKRVHVEGASSGATLRGRAVRIGIVRDVTARKRAQRAALHASKMLARAEKAGALEAMVGALSHEIRTPLTAVQNHASLLEVRLARAAEQAPGLAEDVAPFLRAIHEGVERATGMVEEVARATPSPTDGGKAAAALDEVVREALALFRATRVRPFEVESDLRLAPAVAVDKLQVQHALLHLLRNGHEASPPGGARLRVRTRASADGHALLVVEDEGEGIPAEVQDLMYEPLFTTKEGHLGFGLSIVKGIADDHGARIHCDSRPGEGARFTLEFPPSA